MTTKKNVKKITDFSLRQQAPVKKKNETPVSEQADAIDVTQEWFIRNWKLAVAAVVLIAAVIAVVVIINHVRDAADQKARAEIASASTITALTEVLSKHAENPASVGAAQRLASLYLAEKDFENARKALKFIIDFEKANPYIRTRAAVDSAGILEVGGSREAACSEFRAIAADPAADEVLRAEAAYAAARIAFELRDWNKAEEALAMINTARADSGSSDPYSAWAVDALALKGKLEAAKKAPESAAKKTTDSEAKAAAPAAEAKAPAASKKAAAPAAKKQADKKAAAPAAKKQADKKAAAPAAKKQADSAKKAPAPAPAAPKATSGSK